jgi:hypothetical protein
MVCLLCLKPPLDLVVGLELALRLGLWLPPPDLAPDLGLVPGLSKPVPLGRVTLDPHLHQPLVLVPDLWSCALDLGAGVVPDQILLLPPLDLVPDLELAPGLSKPAPPGRVTLDPHLHLPLVLLPDLWGCALDLGMGVVPDQILLLPPLDLVSDLELAPGLDKPASLGRVALDPHLHLFLVLVLDLESALDLSCPAPSGRVTLDLHQWTWPGTMGA